MSIERAFTLDNILSEALSKKEKGNFPSVTLPGGSPSNLRENLSLGKVLSTYGYGDCKANGTSFYITEDGLDFIRCGGFTQRLKDEAAEEERKETQYKLNKKNLKAAKREPLFRWLAIIFGLANVIQLFMQLF